MMATLVGELAPALKHKGTFSVAPTPSERRLCQNGSITSRSRVHVRSSSSNEKVGFRGCGMLGKGLGFVVNATRISLSSTSSNLTARARSYAIGNPMFRHSSEFKDFVEELRFQATRLHIEEQGNSQVFKSASSAEEYLKFLVVSKMVYETMEVIVINSSHPACELNFIMPPTGCAFCLAFRI